jgi:hypothetical protein
MKPSSKIRVSCCKFPAIAASILAARKLAQYGSEAQVPATICAIGDAIQWAERIMQEIDRRWPEKMK